MLSFSIGPFSNKGVLYYKIIVPYYNTNNGIMKCM